MQVFEVGDSSRLIKEFIELPIRLYKNYPNWIRPLDADIEEVFDPKRNKFFRHGECTRWVLKDDHGITIGRVAAFINNKTARSSDQPTGGMGFFECIENEEAAFILFDICKQWLQEREMEAMDGPINFGERDKWWGLLLEGDFEPNYCMPYNPPYYKAFFEAYGFQVYFYQYTYFRPVDGDLSPKIFEKYERLKRDPGFRFEHMKLSQIEKYTEDFRTIYNKAWGKHAGVAAMPEAQAKALMKKLKQVIDEKIFWYGYYNNEPIAFFIILPELNQIFKHVNGKLDWIGKLKFLWHRYVVGIHKMFGVAFGVVPEFQGKGVEGAIVIASANLIQKKLKYREFEMNWIGDFNPKMMHVAESVGGQVRKVHATYRKLFDESKPFKRCPVIE